jgi:hypothetical protein
MDNIVAIRHYRRRHAEITKKLWRKRVLHRIILWRKKTEEGSETSPRSFLTLEKKVDVRPGETWTER